MVDKRKSMGSSSGRGTAPGRRSSSGGKSGQQIIAKGVQLRKAALSPTASSLDVERWEKWQTSHYFYRLPALEK